MEDYAVRRLMRIFKNYKNLTVADNKVLATAIVNALTVKTKVKDKFKIAFWKLLWNLKLKGAERSKKTLDDLFNRRWKTVQDFINASDDELDVDCAMFRNNVRMKEFQRMQNTKRINDLLDDKQNDTSEIVKLGLVCSRCHSNNTEYSCLQIRSGDEGMTTFVVCLNCKKRWKFS